ncbi:MAG: IS1634 family transposase, partial [Bacteroidota bacterium]
VYEQLIFVQNKNLGIENQSLKLIITYSKDRARKDLNNREKGLKRLEKQVRSGKLTKSHINKRGYNKYLKLKGELQVVIDRERCKEDARWDGLKGYLTNARLDYDSVLANYQHLWQIEKAFRISKSDLKIRPIFHRLQRRIEAHICLTFVSYKIYKELERLLKEKQTQLSPEKAIEIAKSIFRITLQTPSSKTTVQKTLINTEEQVLLAKTFNF